MGLSKQEGKYQPVAQGDDDETGYEGASLVVSSSTPAEDGKFPDRPVYRDLLFTVLFVIHLVAVVVILGVSAKDNESSSSTSNSSVQPTTTSINTSLILRFIGVCALGVAGAFGFAFVWLLIMKAFAKQLIYFTLIASAGLSLVMAAYAFLSGVVVMGVFFLFVALIHVFIFFMWRSRIPFATAMLQTVAGLLKTYPAPSVFAYLSVIIIFLWVILWVPTFALVQQYNKDHEKVSRVLSIFLVLSFYWVSQVIKNVVHVTASGLFATWYFLSGSYGMPPNPTLKSFKRAMTTSFGSICLGSLLVAILKTIRQLVASLRGRNVLLRCFAECILALLDRLLQYFNLYAFTQVAIYGKSYCEAAKDTWRLLQTHGVYAIINDNLISGVLLMGSVLGGLVCALVGGVAGKLLLASHDAEGVWIITAILCFIIGISLVTLAMEVVESGVATIFVCFAMDSQALQRNSPELYRTLTEQKV